MPQLRNVRSAVYTNQDISAYRFVGDYTAPFNRTLHATLTAKELAGGGNYSAYYTMQRTGAADVFVGPTITVNVPATNTAVLFEFTNIIAEPYNVFRFYIQGLAGDTTTPDTALRIFEEMSHDILDWGVVTAATGTRITASGLGSLIDDTYNGRLIKFVEPNSGYCETTYITDYDATAGMSGYATIDVAAATSITTDWLFYIYPQYKLTPQDVRDAAKLAPSAGAPATGSIDLHLDDLITDTGTDLPASLASLANALAVVDGIADSILEDTGTTLPASLASLAASLASLANALAVVDGIADSILEDTGTTLPGEHAALTLLLNAILSDTGTDLPASLAALADAIAVIDGIADAILEDTGTTLPAQIEAMGGEAIVPYLELILEDTGTTLPAEHAALSDTLAEILDKVATADGPLAFVYTLTSSTTGLPIAEALVEAYTNADMTNLIDQQRTNNSGVVTFHVTTDIYHLRRIKAGYTFTNPQSITVDADHLAGAGTGTPITAYPTAITLASLRAACRRTLASTNDWSDNMLDAWLIEAIRTYSIQMPRRWQHTITLTADSQTYAVPGKHGFHRILNVEYLPAADDEDSPASPYFLTEVPKHHNAFIRKTPVYALTGIADSTDISADDTATNITFAQDVTEGDTAIVTYLGDWPTPTIASDNDAITIPASHTEALLAFVIFRAHWELVTDRAYSATTSSSVLATLAESARRAWGRYKEIMNTIDASTTPAGNAPTKDI